MKFIEEVVVDEFLPTFRSMLAEELRDRNLTQSEVAEAIGVSQSAVSKYVHGGIERRPEVHANEDVRELVHRLGRGLADGTTSRVEALIEAEVLIRQLEARGRVLGDLHEKTFPELASYDGEFHVHDPNSRLRTEVRVRSSVRRGLRILENASGFAGLIPNVGSNLVECTPTAETIDDVVGVPGRIFDVKGRASIPGEPEFGVSAHVAGVLLAARAGGSEARSAINIRYDPEIVDFLADRGHSVLEIDGDSALTERITIELHARPDATIVTQTGGFGIEPITYILAPNAVSAAEIIRSTLNT